ncbi:MAG: winged helix family transcriptional regulator [Proteobacteria bacterium]|nr:MAG: winged helix family transcriptional regulator [Pseudomonadota bacterium]
MGIVWVIEKPGRLENSIASILQGDVAVRAFASVRNFLKLGRLSSVQPKAILIDGDDFASDVENLEKLIEIHWGESKIVVVASEGIKTHSGTFFVPKSSFLELPFVMQRLLHNEKPEKTRFTVMNDLCLDFEGNRLRVLPEGEWMHLTLKEAQILRHLIRFQNRFLSHEDLCNEIWKDVKVSPKSVSSHMSRLRRNLLASQLTIESIYGGGYRLVSQALDP